MLKKLTKYLLIVSIWHLPTVLYSGNEVSASLEVLKERAAVAKRAEQELAKLARKSTMAEAATSVRSHPRARTSTRIGTPYTSYKAAPKNVAAVAPDRLAASDRLLERTVPQMEFSPVLAIAIAPKVDVEALAAAEDEIITEFNIRIMELNPYDRNYQEKYLAMQRACNFGIELIHSKERATFRDRDGKRIEPTITETKTGRSLTALEMLEKDATVAIVSPAISPSTDTTPS